VAPAPGLTEVALDRLRERRSAKWSEYGADVLPSWVAEMDFPLAPPVRHALAAAIERDDTGYANPAASGLAAALAGFLERRQGWAVDPDQVVTCNDVVAGLTDLLALLLEPGERVVITPPVYHPFFTLVPEAGCAIWEVPLAGGRALDLDGIAAAFAAGARAMVLCNPHNPTGSVASRAELAGLAELAAEHDAWILADEIHAPLTLAGAEHVPFLTVSGAAAERGIALVSASKAFNLAGLGCAQIVTAAEGPRAAVAELPFSATHCGHLGAIAAEAAYRDGDEWLDAVPAVLDGNRELLSDLLGDLLPEARHVPPRGGYLAWIDLSAYGLGADPAAPILERGRVALSSGPMFGSGGEGHVRLNAGTSPELLSEAVRRMARAIDA
jgi:cystathionine beta-lyase